MKCKVEVRIMIHITTLALPSEFRNCLFASNYEWHNIAGISVLTYLAAYSEATGSILIINKKGLHNISIIVIGMKDSSPTTRPLLSMTPHSLKFPAPYD